jgi:hypothetical protein
MRAFKAPSGFNYSKLCNRTHHRLDFSGISDMDVTQNVNGCLSLYCKGVVATSLALM